MRISAIVIGDSNLLLQFIFQGIIHLTYQLVKVTMSFFLIKFSMTTHLFVFVFFQCFMYYFWQREREQGKDRVRGRQRIWSRFYADSSEPNAMLKPTNHEVMTWAKVGRSTYWSTKAAHGDHSCSSSHLGLWTPVSIVIRSRLLRQGRKTRSSRKRNWKSRALEGSSTQMFISKEFTTFGHIYFEAAPVDWVSLSYSSVIYNILHSSSF